MNNDQIEMLQFLYKIYAENWHTDFVMLIHDVIPISRLKWILFEKSGMKLSIEYIEYIEYSIFSSKPKENFFWFG